MEGLLKALPNVYEVLDRAEARGEVAVPPDASPTEFLRAVYTDASVRCHSAFAPPLNARRLFILSLLHRTPSISPAISKKR